jgi:hypothetical protein
MPITCGFGKLGKTEIQCFAGFDSGFVALWTVNCSACAIRVFSGSNIHAINNHPQLFLDDNGIVDIARTRHEGEKVNASKMNANLAGSQNRASRRRRAQSQKNAGLTSDITTQLEVFAAQQESEFEGWMFGAFLDCKVGVSSSSFNSKLVLTGHNSTLSCRLIVRCRYPHSLYELPKACRLWTQA